MLPIFFVLILPLSPARAERPSALAAVESGATAVVETCPMLLGEERPAGVSVYARWLVEDGVVKPLAQIDQLLTKYTRVGEQDFMDDVREFVGPAGEVLPHIGRMIKLGKQINALGHGYRALVTRCGNVSEELGRDRLFVNATLTQTERILTNARKFLNDRPGREAAWVSDGIDRVDDVVRNFRRGCVENPPVQNRGVFERLKRMLWI